MKQQIDFELEAAELAGTQAGRRTRPATPGTTVDLTGTPERFARGPITVTTLGLDTSGGGTVTGPLTKTTTTTT